MLFKSALFLALPLASEATYYRGSRTELVMEFDGSGDTGVRGTIELTQDDDENTVGTWKVRLHVDEDKVRENPECAEFNGLFNWHVHNAPIGDDSGECGGTITGGHYDPTYACGGASQGQSTGVGGGPLAEGGVSACAAINEYRPGYTYSGEDGVCSQDNQAGCERGDQSGKMGKIEANPSSSWWNWWNSNEQEFEDLWLGDVADIVGRSIVLHCCQDNADGCKKRAVCANIVVA